MIKKIILSIISIIVNVFHFFYNYKVSQLLSQGWSMLYTLWVKQEFKSFGTKSYLSYPLYLKGGKYISIGEGVGFGKRLRLEAWEKYNETTYEPQIMIGNHVSIGHDCHFGAIGKLQIGDNTLIASKVFITDHSHGTTDTSNLQTPPIKRDLYSKGDVIIEDGVWIGEGVAILSGVTIGQHSIIGANSVVTKNIPPNSIAGGIPARIIKSVE